MHRAPCCLAAGAGSRSCHQASSAGDACRHGLPRGTRQHWFCVASFRIGRPSLGVHAQLARLTPCMTKSKLNQRSLHPCTKKCFPQPAFNCLVVVVAVVVAVAAVASAAAAAAAATVVVVAAAVAVFAVFAAVAAGIVTGLLLLLSPSSLFLSLLLFLSLPLLF